MGTYENVDYAPDILSMLFVQNGVDLENMSSANSRVADTLNFYTSFTIDPTNSVWDNTLDASTLAFSKGNLAMYFGYSRDYFTIKAYNPALNFEIVPAPQLTGQNSTIASYWAEGASVKTSHQQETLAFMKYLTREDVEDKLYASEAKTGAFGQPYAKAKMAALLSSNANVYPFVLQAQTATSSYFAFGTYDNGLNKQANAYLENAINSILNNNISVQDAANALSQGVAQIASQYK
jgi:multiple sugar transport system substrate-binding protein